MTRRFLSLAALLALSQLCTGCYCMRHCVGWRIRACRESRPAVCGPGGCGPGVCTPAFRIPAPLHAGPVEPGPIFSGPEVGGPADCPTCYGGNGEFGPVSFTPQVVPVAPVVPYGGPVITGPTPILPGPRVETVPPPTGLPAPMPVTPNGKP